MVNPEARTNNGGVENRAEEFEPRPFENTIIALDVDGVLVNPLAYRQAVRSTITFFAEQIGVNPEDFLVYGRNKTPGRNMNHFEAEGIYDPWDVSAIIVSLMKLKKAGINVSNGEALDAFRNSSSPQSHPPEVILAWIIKEYRGVTIETMQDITKTLSQTRDPFKNEVTSIFQEYVLGKETFEETYGRPSLTGAEESLIITKDQSLIGDKGRKELEKISREGGMVVIYTGRPGLPPYDYKRKRVDGYPPEAELAVKKSRIGEPIGIVSMGSMEWLARMTKVSVESLTKPNPTQALATILSGLRGGTDMRVLMDAYDWGQTGKAPEDIQPFIGNKATLELVVVEDSPSGVRAFINARKILTDQSVNVELSAIGVHGASYEKHMAFARLAQEEGVFIDTNSNTSEGIIRYSYDVQGREENGSSKVTTV
ncbi:MAG: hypothetical protein HY427_00185 [Candidatus Levybacteria bacterium]|nr:hypothetical protein [Candidatus Levybacteria bacterium]